MFKGFGRPKKKSVLEENELTTGIVQHPVTGLWQTWISFTGNDIQCITAHANPDDADRVAKQIADAWSEGKHKTGEEVTAFIKSLPTDGVIDPLPQNIVMQLSQQALSARK
ncbi:MAG: hypothetical protein RM049_34695 [Nostoc sp. DedQUE04]|uniref:hypothetical protein n=1 Tax=Nostoc sp. DedQUE04 TaxID=3075390 RepID=UPI002AD21580|nr:hypothetical protein [Nostoc sp. DedQUE04]MDZ8140385.1 hypothetical protein [Nostoc sp. DedQUE04]